MSFRSPPANRQSRSASSIRRPPALTTWQGLALHDCMFPARCVLATMAALLSCSAQTIGALLWSNGVGHASAELPVFGKGGAGFTLMSSAQTGVTFTNTLQGDAFLTNAVAHNGSGVAIGDVDGDGLADVYLCNLQGPNQLYRNLGGWRFALMPLGEAACATQFSTSSCGAGNLK